MLIPDLEPRRFTPTFMGRPHRGAGPPGPRGSSWATGPRLVPRLVDGAEVALPRESSDEAMADVALAAK